MYASVIFTSLNEKLSMFGSAAYTLVGSLFFGNDIHVTAIIPETTNDRTRFQFLVHVIGIQSLL